eukprot:TRINITY_DN5622_c0_g1_i1.p1 TRINITY_DN5622_c0_g1~~TRINITY_DN5622_c0_g1_i1.p1  ORF type:complete len:638 (-),score=82.44 TRINITY_DN5622_c0_g1_i1:285-2198(-)
MAKQGVHELQRAAVIKMLNIGAADQQQGGATQSFKVLVYDKFGQDVLAPLLKIGGLRKHGVTLNLNITSDRLPVTDTPAVYFVEPTAENINRINDDIKKGLYESCYINFASAVPRSLLEELARGAMRANAANKVAGVFDRYISFASLSSSLFTLNLPGAYEMIHSPTQDLAMQGYIERVVDGLLSVLVTNRMLPVIRCPPGFAAEMVGRRLEERIRDLLNRGSAAAADLFSAGARAGLDPGMGSQRPLLCLFDRDVDLVTMIGHTWTYHAMCHDLLNLKLNQLNVPADDDGSSGKMTQLFVDDSDTFWATHGGEVFPNVASAVDKTIEEFMKTQAAVTAKTGQSGMGDSLAPAMAEAINMLPEITEKRRGMERHTNIAHALLNLVKSRQLDRYYTMEDEFRSQSLGTSITQLEELIADKDAGTPLDKARALMVLYLTKPSMTPSQLQGVTEALRANGGDTAGVSFLQHLASIKNVTESGATNAASLTTASSGIMGNFGDFAQRVGAKGGGLLAAGFDNFKNIVASNKELAICKLLDSLMENKTNPETDKYLYLDPKASPAAYGNEQTRIRSPFRSACSFVVGGGSYVEMQSVQEWAQEHSRHVIYGATDMVSPQQFVEELSSLGRSLGEGSASVDLT